MTEEFEAKYLKAHEAEAHAEALMIVHSSAAIAYSTAAFLVDNAIALAQLDSVELTEDKTVEAQLQLLLAKCKEFVDVCTPKNSPRN